MTESPIRSARLQAIRATAANVRAASPEFSFAYHAKAQDLRVPQDGWPTCIDTDLGNGNPFYYDRTERDPMTDELKARVYVQAFGYIELRVTP